MARPELSILISARDEASKVLGRISNQTEDMSRQFRKAGMIMTAAGGAIVGVLGMAVKAAAEEQAGVIRLSTAMKNVGLDYEANKDQIEGVIDAMQQKTAVADTDQRDSLASLVRVTRDMNKALELNELAMDIARGTGRDLASATTMLQYAIGGTWGQVERIIPALKMASTEQEKWTMLQELFVGQAEAYGQSVAGQFELLKNNIGDIKESIGMALIPVVEASVKPFQRLAQAMKAIPPQLIQVGVGGAAATGTLLLLGGPMLILISYLPRIAVGFHAVTAAMVRARVAAVGLRVGIGGLLGAVGLLATAAYFVYEAMNKDREILEITADNLKEHSKATQENVDWINKEIEALEGSLEVKHGLKRATEEEMDWLKQAHQLRDELTVAVIAQTQAEEDMATATAKVKDEMAALEEELSGVTQSWKDMAESLGYTYSEAGRLNLTIADVVRYMTDMTDTTVSLQHEIDGFYFRLSLFEGGLTDANVALRVFGLEGKTVAEYLENLTPGVEGLADGMEHVAAATSSANQALTAAQQALLALIPLWRGGVMVGAYAPQVLEAMTRGPVLGPGGQSIIPPTPGPGAHYDPVTKSYVTDGYQHGGVVPGPYGAPRLIMAHGGETVSPPGRGHTGDVHIHVGTLMGDEVDARMLAQEVLKYIREDHRRTYGLSA